MFHQFAVRLSLNLVRQSTSIVESMVKSVALRPVVNEVDKNCRGCLSFFSLKVKVLCRISTFADCRACLILPSGATLRLVGRRRSVCSGTSSICESASTCPDNILEKEIKYTSGSSSAAAPTLLRDAQTLAGP